jgi:hypothetical protein
MDETRSRSVRLHGDGGCHRVSHKAHVGEPCPFDPLSLEHIMNKEVATCRVVTLSRNSITESLAHR